MNELTFARYNYICLPSLEGARRIRMDLVVPVVDGEPLTELVGHDGPPGLQRKFLDDPRRRWGANPQRTDAEGRAVLVDGTCGDDDCCGLRVAVVATASTVQWSHLAGSGIADGALWSFEFTRWQYEQALESISHLRPAATEWLEVPRPQ